MSAISLDRNKRNMKDVRNILVVNIGSSSVKYALFVDFHQVIRDTIDRVSDCGSALRKMCDNIRKHNFRVDAVAHRVVHGGTHCAPAIISSRKLQELKKISELAPLHNPRQVKGIKECIRLFDVPQVAVFDTAFHQTMPDYAYTYAIPRSLSVKYKIRRYGFHGNNHKYVAGEAARILKRPARKLKLITCHLGNGCSVAAIKHGKCIDTSMGFTPTEGLVMGTRCGDIDPAIVPMLQKKEKLGAKAMEDLLNTRCGLKGICGKSDMRDVRHASKNDLKANLAIDVFCYRLTKYIGAYAAVLNGVDAIVFSGGIGENAWWVRDLVLRNFAYIGLRLDNKSNRQNAVWISSFSSKVVVLVLPADEEKMIAREAKEILCMDPYD